MRGVEFGIAEVRGMARVISSALVSGFVTPLSRGDDRRLMMGNAAKRYLLSGTAATSIVMGRLKTAVIAEDITAAATTTAIRESAEDCLKADCKGRDQQPFQG
jgi:hypothetical protein